MINTKLLCKLSNNHIFFQNITRTLSNLVRPQKVSKLKSVPDYIPKPTYVSNYKKYEIENLKKYGGALSRKDMEKFRAACILARRILEEVASLVRAGITTDSLDEAAHELCLQHYCYPAPLLYKSFPKSICTSINNVACHGIPDDRELCDGDILNIDITVFKDGFYGDTSHTYIVNNNDDLKNNYSNSNNNNNIGGTYFINDNNNNIRNNNSKNKQNNSNNNKNTNHMNIVRTAELCRDEAIRICKPGRKFSSIGNIISEISEEQGLKVIADICGHGISSYFHGPPTIYHSANNFEGVMKEGMTFTIEPVICEGSGEVELCRDNWTVISVDGGYSGQFEHTILITKEAAEVLTQLK